MGMEDWQIVLNQALEGDSETFGKLYHEYLSPKVIFPYALKLQNSVREDAEDIVHEVFERLFNKRYYLKIKKRDLKGFEACVRAITYNLWVEKGRKHKQIRYILRAETFEQLQHAEVSEAILHQLRNVRQERPVGRGKFVKLLQKVLRELWSKKLEVLILRHSKLEYSRWVEYSAEMVNIKATENPILEILERQEVVDIFKNEILENLTEEEWLVFYHKHCDDDFTYRKFSGETGIPVSNLFSRYQKAKNKVLSNMKLRAYWREEDNS